MIDTNVFISAVKKPGGGALKLLLKVLEDPSIVLVGNDLLVEEFLRYAQLLGSRTALALVSALLEKTDVVMVKRNYILACKPHITTPDKADILHAATCLQTDSILITNDRHFDRIKKAGIVEVWGITEALKRL
ncbi:MAG: type II toxin-antitoxin system VapC family toxin [Euryarchaeota archaeon]|nr:type II toxin-antitoxin system VapC family toxin [Euryarchaeota archaeon]